jgi:hypothetical protein
MLVNITQTFDFGPKRYYAGDNPDVAEDLGRRWIADGKATLDTDGVANGPAASASAVVGAASVPTAVYEYNDDGTIRKRAMVKSSRILQSGTLLWFPTTTPTSVTATASVANATAGFILSPSGDGSGNVTPPVQITYNTAGFADVVYNGLSIPAPTNGLMQLMLWVEDIDSLGAGAFAGSFYILISLANGTTNSWVFSSSAVRPGWNTIQLWDPTDADQQAVFNRTGISTSGGTPSFAGGTTITSLTFRAGNPTAGSKVRCAGLFSQTIAKPMVAMTFDTSTPDVFSNFVPAFKAKGLAATLRSGGSNAFRDINFNDVPFWQKALSDISNGSFSRLGLSAGTSAAAFAAEVGLQSSWMHRRGLTRGSCLFGSAGNGIPAASVYRSICPQMDITLMKTGLGVGLVKTIGPAGLDDRLAITTTGWPGRTAALRQLRVIQKTGGILMWFAHECPSAGAEPPPDSGSPGSGGGMYAEDAVYFANYLKTLQDSGAVDVVSASQLSAILDGTL